MPQFLVFTLYAPLASFGGLAVGERRTGWDRPARSAVLGLIGAALGLDRSDEAAHLAFDSGYFLALRTDALGRAFPDYHTAQVPPERPNRRYPTRRDQLADKPLGTVVTRREYRSDALHVAALWTRGDPPYNLTALMQALQRPHYALSLGRKSCPLGLPLAPDIIDAEDVFAAFRQRDAKLEASHAKKQPPEAKLRRELGAAPGGVAMDAEIAPPGALRIERRRDAIASRRRWQFVLRDEAVLDWTG